MSLTVIIILILLGFILFAVEFLIVPGITVAGIGAFLLVGGGVFSAYYFQGATIGNYILLGTAIGLIAFFIFIFKGKTWKRFGLISEIDGRVGELEEGAISVGDTGETVSRLAPIGKAMIGDQIFEVRSDGSYIDSHKMIKVTRIDGIKIFVELK